MEEKESNEGSREHLLHRNIGGLATVNVFMRCPLIGSSKPVLGRVNTSLIPIMRDNRKTEMRQQRKLVVAAEQHIEDVVVSALFQERTNPVQI